MILNKD